MSKPRVVILADPCRADVAQTCVQAREAIAQHAELVAELPPDGGDLPSNLDVDLAVVVGGDGTLIRQAGHLAARDIPLIGVNVGRLGFLAEFDGQSLMEHAKIVFGPNPPVHAIIMLESTLLPDGKRQTERGVAVNDCVISAGEPFRIIELRLSIDGAQGPTLTGDGVIVCSPIGSTAYNVSAGGPIVYPAVEAMVITPLAAHSLAFRPIVVGAESVLRIEVIRANEGTALVQDGQVVGHLGAGAAVEIRRHSCKARFVANPATTYWRILQEKLRWAAPPMYRELSDS